MGELELIYTGNGTYTGPDSTKSNIFTWTYDRDNNVFVSSHDTKYVRPTESIKDRVILF